MMLAIMVSRFRESTLGAALLCAAGLLLCSSPASAQLVVPTVAVKYDGFQQGSVSLGVAHSSDGFGDWSRARGARTTFLQIEPGRAAHKVALGRGWILNDERDLPFSLQAKGVYARTRRTTGEHAPARDFAGPELSAGIGTLFPLTSVYAGALKQVRGPRPAGSPGYRAYVGASIGFGAH
jgi:hypothetical protein